MSESPRATLRRWYRCDGEVVRVGEPLFEIETDEACVDVPATESGRLRQLAKVGDVIEAGMGIARIEPV